MSCAALGVDIGASKIAFSAIQHERSADYVLSLNDNPDFDQQITLLTQTLQEIKNDFPDAEFKIAIAAAPLVDKNGVIAQWPNRPEWIGTSLFDLFAVFGGSSPQIIDDGYAATLTEKAKYHGENILNLVFGSGVGGGVVFAGEALHDKTFGALGLGHMVVLPNGRACVCGQAGCLQAYAGGLSLVKNAQELGVIVNTLQDFSEALVAQNEMAMRIFHDCRTATQIAIESIVSRYRITKIIFSGGLIDLIPDFPSLIEAELHMAGNVTIDIHISRHQNAPLLGALCLALEAIDSSRT